MSRYEAELAVSALYQVQWDKCDQHAWYLTNLDLFSDRTSSV